MRFGLVLDPSDKSQGRVRALICRAGTAQGISMGIVGGLSVPSRGRIPQRITFSGVCGRVGADNENSSSGAHDWRVWSNFLPAL